MRSNGAESIYDLKFIPVIAYGRKRKINTRAQKSFRGKARYFQVLFAAAHLHEFADVFIDVLFVDFHRDEGIVVAAGFERNIFKKIFHYRVQAAGADIFARFVELFGNFGYALDGVRLELKVDGSEYGMLAEGDCGMLSFQGTRYLGFVRGRTQTVVSNE